MTLSVTADVRHEDGAIEELMAIASPASWAGFEEWRRSFYGSEKMRSLGIKLLPSLSHTDIWAAGADLEDLVAEVRLAMEHFPEPEYAFRLANILRATEVAKRLGTGVHVG